MAKNVYLKRYIEEGQRHCVLDEANYKKKRPGYLLFCDSCLTPIRDEDADALVRQNPNVLSFKPMSKKALEEAIEGNTRPSYSPDHINRRILDHDLNEDEPTTMEIAQAKAVLAAAGKKKGAKKDTKKKGAANVIEFVDVEISGEVKDTLETLAKMSDAEFDGLKLKEIREYGAVLGVNVPAVGIKTVDALKALNSKAAELMENVKSDDEDYDAGE
jgi:hypothetical protein